MLKTPAGHAQTNQAATASTTTDANTNGSMTASTTAGTNGGTALTLKDIDPTRPFGDLAVDPTQTRDQVNGTLTTTQQAQLRARCTLIAGSPSFQGTESNFCQAYIKQ